MGAAARQGALAFESGDVVAEHAEIGPQLDVLADLAELLEVRAEEHDLGPLVDEVEAAGPCDDERPAAGRVADLGLLLLHVPLKDEPVLENDDVRPRGEHHAASGKERPGIRTAPGTGGGRNRTRRDGLAFCSVENIPLPCGRELYRHRRKSARPPNRPSTGSDDRGVPPVKRASWPFACRREIGHAHPLSVRLLYPVIGHREPQGRGGDAVPAVRQGNRRAAALGRRERTDAGRSASPAAGRAATRSGSPAGGARGATEPRAKPRPRDGDEPLFIGDDIDDLLGLPKGRAVDLNAKKAGGPKPISGMDAMSLDEERPGALVITPQRGP